MKVQFNDQKTPHQLSDLQTSFLTSECLYYGMFFKIRKGKSLMHAHCTVGNWKIVWTTVVCRFAVIFEIRLCLRK